MPRKIRVWDPLVRIFHWSLVAGFTANALIVDDDGKLHQWIGFVILGLVVIRLAWGFVGPRWARFSSFPPSLRGAMRQIRDTLGRRGGGDVGHTPLGALMIYNLLLTLVVICVSGILMTTDAYWGVEWPEELHEISVAWAEISVLLHIAAVIFESRRTRVNLPRAMVTGWKEFPDA